MGAALKHADKNLILRLGIRYKSDPYIPREVGEVGRPQQTIHGVKQ
jgi:hypothetical protein